MASRRCTRNASRKNRNDDFDYICVEFTADQVRFICKREFYNFQTKCCKWKDKRYYEAKIIEENLNKEGKQ